MEICVAPKTLRIYKCITVTGSALSSSVKQRQSHMWSLQQLLNSAAVAQMNMAVFQQNCIYEYEI